AVILALDALVLNLLLERHIRPQHISFLTFLLGMIVVFSLPVLAVLVYQTVSGLTLRYRLNRNGITIHWGGNALIIPIRAIERVVSGHEIANDITRRRGVRWPGHQWGEGAVPGIGRTQFLASRPLMDQLLLVMPGQAIGISPRDADGFVDAFASRQKLGPNRLLTQELRSASWLSWSLWNDRVARTLLIAAAVINLCLFGYICARFPNLDPQLPLHFNILGQADRIGVKIELFSLPIIGLIILVTNLVLGLFIYGRERAGSYLLWGAAATVQVLLWLAAFSILP
ncbi:PH domain-containing protein, partial [Chloroflexota bacterium]